MIVAGNDDPIVTAHKHCIANREEVLASDQCGCFYCLRIFSPTEITEWLDERNKTGVTALCPHCGIDALIGSRSAYPITSAFLSEMQGHWFQAKSH